MNRSTKSLDPIWRLVYCGLLICGLVILCLGLLSSQQILFFINVIRPRPTGDVIAIIARAIAQWGELVGVVILLAIALLLGFAQRIDQFTLQCTSRFNKRINQSSFTPFVFIIIAMVILFESGTLLWAYFRGDDFTHLVRAHYEPLPKLLLTKAGDHILPVVRLQWRLMWNLFDYNLWAYRFAVVVNFFLVLLSGALFLKKLGCQGLGLTIFIVACAGWPLWGGVTAGYFTLSVYNEVLWLAFLVFLFQIHYSQTKRPLFLILAAACCMIACFMGLYGMWVPIGWLIISLIGNRHDGSQFEITRYVKSEKWMILSAVFILLFTSAFYWIVYTQQGGFLSLRNNSFSFDIWIFLRQLWNFVTLGLALSIPMPYYYLFRDYAFVLFITQGLITLIGLIFGLCVWRHCNNTDRWTAIGLSFIVLGVSIMVCVARPYSEPFYDPRHLCMPFVLLCTSIAFMIDKLCQSIVSKNKAEWLTKWAYTALAILLVNYIVVEIGAFALTRLSGIRPAIPLRSYELMASRERQKALENIKQRLALVYDNHSTSTPIYIPNLDGRYLMARYSSLWDQELAHYDGLIIPKGMRDAVKFVRNDSYLSFANQHTILCRDIREKISDIFIKKIQQESQLSELYCSSVKLAGVQLDPNLPEAKVKVDDWGDLRPMHQEGEVMVKAKKDDSIVIKTGSFDPIENRYLRLAISRASALRNNAKINLALQFQGILDLPYQRNVIALDGPVQIDLLQTPAYAINPKITKMILIFPQAGLYRIRHVAVDPI